jgi:hypothetical protein
MCSGPTTSVCCAQVTDSYLLALVCAHGGQLACFDRRLVKDAVRGGARPLHLIERRRLTTAGGALRDRHHRLHWFGA